VLTVNVEAFQSDTIVPFIADFVHNNECLIVVDEATRIKHEKAKRTKTVHKLEKYGQRAILTGTPVAQSPFNLWSMMEFLKKNYFNCNYFVFQHRYGILMKGTNQFTGQNFNTAIDEKTYAMVVRDLERVKIERNGVLMPNDYETISVMRGTSEKNVRFIEEHPTYTKYKRLDELRDYVAKDVGAVKKEDCLDLPPKIYETLYVDMTPDQKRIYKNLKEELMAEYAGKYVTVANKLALTTRLQQVTGGFFPYLEEERHYSPEDREWYSKVVGAGQLIGNSNAKLDALVEDLDEVDFSTTKVIVWAHFVPELKHIYEILRKDYKARLYYGGTPDDERTKIIVDFKAGDVDVFIANQATAGFGLNLQLSTLHYFFSNDQVVENRLQAEDRSHRIGVRSACVYKDIVVRKTYDEKILALIRGGRDMNDYFKSATIEEILADPEDDENITF
jgi:SNF2 family DNA or RNA helicase